jgi:hypothetical protein
MTVFLLDLGVLLLTLTLVVGGLAAWRIGQVVSWRTLAMTAWATHSFTDCVAFIRFCAEEHGETRNRPHGRPAARPRGGPEQMLSEWPRAS